MAITLFIIGYLAWFAAVLSRRLREPAMRRLSITGRVRELGLGILLLPAVVAVATVDLYQTTRFLMVAAGLALAGWTFLPRFASSKVVPIALVGAGFSAFFTIRLFPIGRDDTYAVRVLMPGFHTGAIPELVLVQAYGLIAAGVWLTWRALDKSGRVAELVLREGPGGSGQPGRSRWGLLLLVVTGLAIELLESTYWLNMTWWQPAQAIAVALVTLLLVFRFPAFAADAAIAGLILFGLYGIALAAMWPAYLTHLSPYTDVLRYGPVWIYSRPSALAAGFVGATITGFGVWVLPRAIDERTKALFRTSAEADLANRVVKLTSTRAEAVDSATAQLRRLERDLHDGAQARLVALGMNLRAAEHLIPTSPELAATLVAEARQTSAKVLDELRGLVRGICPPVLADRGLADAVRALALDTPLRTEVDIDLPGRPELPIETACYFAVSEALTNAVKHSGARSVQIRIWPGDGSLRITVIDDGSGGADPERGSGLLGLERRLATFDGVLAVNSPPGGPTIVAIEVPCALPARTAG